MAAKTHQGPPGTIVQLLCFYDTSSNSFFISGTTSPGQRQTGATGVLAGVIPTQVKTIPRSWSPCNHHLKVLGSKWGGRSLAFVAPSSQLHCLTPKFPTSDPRLTTGKEDLFCGSQHQGKHLPLDGHGPTVMRTAPGVHSVWHAPRATEATNWKCRRWPEARNSFS